VEELGKAEEDELIKTEEDEEDEGDVFVPLFPSVVIFVVVGVVVVGVVVGFIGFVDDITVFGFDDDKVGCEDDEDDEDGL